MRRGKELIILPLPMSNTDDQLSIHVIRDTVTGLYVSSSKYWRIGINELKPKKDAHIYSVLRSANALRNKASKEISRSGEYVESEFKKRQLRDDEGKLLDDWLKRKSLKFHGFEVVTYTV